MSQADLLPFATDVTKLSIAGVRFYEKTTGYTVLSVRDADKASSAAFTAICSSPFSLCSGQIIEVTEGHWVQHPKYGRQLKIENFTIPDPVTKDGIERYLASGIVRGIGPAMANRIVQKFGEKTLQVLDDDPGRLIEVPGIGPAFVDKIGTSWKENRSTAKVLSALCGLGLSVAYAIKVFKHFGNRGDIVQTIRGNPYLLTEVFGIGFTKADEIAKTIGISPDHPYRIRSGLLYMLQMATESGHCYLPKASLVKEAEKLLSVDFGLIERMMFEMEEEGAFVNDQGRYYLPVLHKAERFCEKKLQEVVWGAKPTSSSAAEETIALHDYLTEDQATAVSRAVTNAFSVITGLPGTGKTLVTKVIVDVLKRLGYSYALCAPTGKAARRLEQASENEAKTIHRLLEYVPGMGFARNQDNPVEEDYVIVDEASMVDILLMATLLTAIKPGGRVVMIGDVDQLPSVGPGSVLKDLIVGNVCWVTRLTKIHRQAEGSGIIRAAHDINAGQRPGLSTDKEADAVQIGEDNDQQMRQEIVSAIKNGGYPLEDVQVLTPMKRGTLGVYELNKLLQAELNRHATSEKGEGLKGFYLHDRVMHLVNNYDKLVFNGEVGYVVGIDQENATVSVDYEGKFITYEESDLDQISLAYAITIHKSQGSQFPCVIIPLHGQHYVMLKRQLLYTAVTRAQSKVVVVSASKFLAMAAKNNTEERRFTGLFKARKAF